MAVDQLNRKEAFRPPVEEQQVNVIMLVVERHPSLPGDQTKALAEFQEKILQMIEQGALQL